MGSRGLSSPTSSFFGGSRIAKPLRGGGAAPAGGAEQNGEKVVLSGVQNSVAAQEMGAGGQKRSSWWRG